QAASRSIGLEAVIARARLAAHDVALTVAPEEVEQSPRRALRDHVGEGAAGDGRDLGRQYPLARRARLAQPRLVGGALGELDLVHQNGWIAQAVVHEDAHQLGERGGPVAGGADRARERWRERREGIAEALPAALDLEESAELQQVGDALVLRI